MKRNLLVITSGLLATISSVGAYTLTEKDGNKLEVSGKMGLEHYITKDEDKKGDCSYGRIKLNGESTISKDLVAFGEIEGNFKLKKEKGKEHVTARTLMAGMKGERWGSLAYGRMPSILANVSDYTDNLPLFGGDATGIGCDKFGTGRSNNLLQYRTPKLGGVQLGVQYTGSNREDKENIAKGNGEGYAAALTYDSDFGLSVGAAYSDVAKQKEFGVTEKTYNNDNRAKVLLLGAKYEQSGFQLGGVYGETQNQKSFKAVEKDNLGTDGKVFAGKTWGMEVVAKYNFASGFTPSIAYLESTIKKSDRSPNQSKGKDMQYIDLGAEYKFNKNFSACVDYKINLLKKDRAKTLSASRNDALGLGVTYHFL